MIEACFARQDQAREALRELPALFRTAGLDPAARQLLPLLCRRWPASSLDPALAKLGPRHHLALWRQNRRRLAAAASIARGLREASIECLWLKGVALLLGAYADVGLRGMADVDFLVREEDTERAIEWLLGEGWAAEEGFSAAEIVRFMRVGHGWQFERALGDEKETCDLHWRPVVRCYSPRVTALFWSGARRADLEGLLALIPCRTDQLFHVCAHGFEWSGSSRIRWIPDALTLLETPAEVDWDRLSTLAGEAGMTARMASMLRYLRERFGAEAPRQVLEALESAPAPRWEIREGALLQKNLPLGFMDSVKWHITHFRRLRRFDAGWSRRPAAPAFVEYLALFLRVRGAGALASELWRQIRLRARASRHFPRR
jgi:hypothetical protein